MGTDTLSVELSPVEDPSATPYGVASDNNRSAAVFNGVFQEKWNTLAYLKARIAELIGTPILISGVSAATDKVTTASAHGLSAGTLIRFKALNGGTLPAGLDAAGFAGYVLADTSTTFKVAATSGGAAIDITSSGSGDLYVYAVPDLLGELITSSGAGAEGSLGDLFVTLDSTQTIAGAKTVDDITASGTTKYKLASRGITRVHMGDWYEDTGNLTKMAPRSIPVDSTSTSPFVLPNGSTLTGITFYIDPADHSGTGLPGTMPTFQIWKLELATATATQIGTTAVDSSANAVAYSALHTIVKSGLSEVIDNANYRYWLIFTGEGGANKATIPSLVGVKLAGTVTEQDDGAS